MPSPGQMAVIRVMLKWWDAGRYWSADFVCLQHGIENLCGLWGDE